MTAAAGASRTVWDGVYSKDQADRGKKIYEAQCARCHGEALLGGDDSPPLVDSHFLDQWSGKSIGSLVEFTRTTMPSDGPGKLSQKECTDIIAYLLSANNFPAGQAELAADSSVQSEIFIQVKK